MEFSWLFRNRGITGNRRELLFPQVFHSLETRLQALTRADSFYKFQVSPLRETS